MRLTVAKDWSELQRYADEIVLCREIEAAAHQDMLDAEANLKAAEDKARTARLLHYDRKKDTESAQAAFARVMDEMTKPTDYAEVQGDG